MKNLLTFSIWHGETLYQLCGAPMNAKTVIEKYGVGLHSGAYAVIKNADGIVSEISPLSNVLSRFGVDIFPDDYQNKFYSPIQVNDKGEILLLKEKSPEMLELEQKVNEFIPIWSRYQGYLQQRADYDRSNLCIADAHRGLSYDDGFKAYVARNMEDANLLGNNPEKPKLLLEASK